MIKLNQLFIVSTIILISCSAVNKSTREVIDTKSRIIIHELNEKELPKGDKIIALIGAKLIDGNGGEPIQNSCVLIRNDKIEFAGKAATFCDRGGLIRYGRAALSSRVHRSSAIRKSRDSLCRRAWFEGSPLVCP